MSHYRYDHRHFLTVSPLEPLVASSLILASSSTAVGPPVTWPGTTDWHAYMGRERGQGRTALYNIIWCKQPIKTSTNTLQHCTQSPVQWQKPSRVTLQDPDMSVIMASVCAAIFPTVWNKMRILLTLLFDYHHWRTKGYHHMFISTTCGIQQLTAHTVHCSLVLKGILPVLVYLVHVQYHTVLS